MLFVRRVEDCVQEVCIATGAAHVFGRAGVLPADALRMLERFVRYKQVLYNHAVSPTVAEVIPVFEVIVPVPHCLTEFDSPFAAKAFVWPFLIRFTEAEWAEVELVQMSTLPAYGVKNYAV